MRFTTVLVHGAFAESASWARVLHSLSERERRIVAPGDVGHHIIAAANPLRALAADAASVADLVRTIEGPVVLVGHSYGGAVISNVPADAGDIIGLVFAGAFAPDVAETCFELAARFPGSTLGNTIHEVPRVDGRTDLYIALDRFHAQFCADLPTSEAMLMGETQRPVTREALTEPSGARPLWRERPSCFVYGDEDRNIPAALHRFMAERAGARHVIEVSGASHAIAVSQPDAVAQVILHAAGLTAVA